MELKEQVCTLEQAKRLRELGVQQDGVFQWRYWPKIAEKDMEPELHLEKVLPTPYSVMKVVDAFTVSELGEMLPQFVPSYKSRDGRFVCVTISHETPNIIGSQDLDTAVEMTLAGLTQFETSNNEAQTRAAMLIYLLENKLI